MASQVRSYKKYSLSITKLSYSINSSHSQFQKNSPSVLKAVFCLGTSGTLYPETLGCFFLTHIAFPIFEPQGPPRRSWNCDAQKIANYFMLGG